MRSQYTEEQEREIMRKGYEIYQTHEARLCDKLNAFSEEKMKRENENMSSPVFIELLCDEILADGFAHISVQEALILYTKILGCENHIVDKSYRVLNGGSEDRLSVQLYQNLIDYAKELKNNYSKMWRNIYTAPELIIWNCKMGLYFWNIIFAGVVKLRMNGSTENYIPDTLKIQDQFA